MSSRTLVADIGGTNTRVALANDRIVDQNTVRRFSNADAADFATVLRRYLEETQIDAGTLDGACAAGAGPVQHGAVTLTNLDWRISPEILQDTLGTSHVAVLNDLQAQGFAVGYAAQGTVDTLTPGASDPQSQTKLVVGVGTGFNAAPIFETAAGRMVMPSESGHIALPELDDATSKVIAYLEEKYGFPSVEEALSGRGLTQVDAAVNDTEGRDAPALMADLEAGDASAADAIRTVVALLGAVVGDLALITLPFGGISLVGGVTGHLAPWFEPFGLLDAMRAKGRFGNFMEQFGVEVVTDDYAALTGCAVHLSGK